MTIKRLFTNTRTVLLLSALTLSLASCTKKPVDPQDPYENFNRAVYSFNDFLDKTIMRPAAKTYNYVTPYFVQRGVTNFFHNIGEITTLPNDLLQGKFKYAGIDIARLVINTTFGIGGLFDVASRAGIPEHHEDFGMTLAYYSKDKQSPYLVLPFWGPSTFRDAFAKPFDVFASPWPYLRPYWLSYALVALYYVDFRTRLLAADKLVESSFDPYVFVRDAYLQKRREDIANNEHDYQAGESNEEYDDMYIKPRNTTAQSDNTDTNEQPIIVTGH